MIIQIVGIVFCIYLLYISYKSFRREEFSLGDFLVWLSIWIVLLLMFAFPWVFRVLQKQLQVTSLVEIIFTILIAFLVLIVFHMYTRLNRLALQFEESIQHRAQEDGVAPTKRKKSKK